jgi:hypothetical protein
VLGDDALAASADGVLDRGGIDHMATDFVDGGIIPTITGQCNQIEA